MNYIRFSAQAFLEQGHTVIVCACTTFDHFLGIEPRDENFNKLYYHHLREFKEETPKNLFSRLLGQQHQIEFWEQIVQSLKDAAEQFQIIPDLVFFPTIDHLLFWFPSNKKFSNIFPFKWSAIHHKPLYMKLRLSLPWMKWLPIWPTSLLYSSNCRSFAIPDINLRNKHVKDKKGVWIPDCIFEQVKLVETPFIADLRKEIAGKKVVTLIGVNDKRKGLLDLMACVPKLQEENIHVVIAGEIIKDTFSEREIQYIDHIAQQYSSAVTIKSQYLSWNDFTLIAKLSNILFAYYRNHPYVSNIVTLGAKTGVPLVVTAGTYMSQLVSIYRLGECLHDTNHNKLTSVLIRMCSAEYRSRYLQDSLCDDYNEDHSFENFKQSLSQLV